MFANWILLIVGLLSATSLAHHQAARSIGYTNDIAQGNQTELVQIQHRATNGRTSPTVHKISRFSGNNSSKRKDKCLV